PIEEYVELANSLRVNLVQQPSKYLGVHFKLRGNRIADFQFLIDKLQAKLHRWKMKLLSQAGRTTLIAFVLQSLPLYSFSCFKVSDAVCSKMDFIIRAFWWGHDYGERKLHLINWDRISQPKRMGGLRILVSHLECI
ncbi:putative ribonuclease h protein, partial [Quercus suber]